MPEYGILHCVTQLPCECGKITRVRTQLFGSSTIFGEFT